MKIAVIGSGLASFACCNVLTKNNFFPDVFDIGDDLDLEQKEIKGKIKKFIEKKKRVVAGDGNKDALASILDTLLQQKSLEYPKKKYFGSEKLYNYINKSLIYNNPSYSSNFGGF